MPSNPPPRHSPRATIDDSENSRNHDDSSSAPQPPPNNNSNTTTNFPTLTPGRFLFLSSIPLGLGAYIGYRQALKDSLESPTSSGNSIFGRIMMHPETTTSSVATSKNPTSSYVRNATATPTIHNIVSVNNHPQNPINLISNAPKNILNPPPTPLINTIPPAALATRALAIGSLLSLSATSLLVAGIFLVTGSHSLEELVAKAKKWAPEKLNDLQTSLGMEGVKSSEERLDSLEYDRAVRGMTEEEEWEYFKGRYGGNVFGAWDDDGGGDKGREETSGN
mmetsp:Transcript_21698/g.45913  ORF Transcript_21698/g.45913 Transcript_21698/m.45913 type:complete len:279 (-) Transcript_21698:48-884(-)